MLRGMVACLPFSLRRYTVDSILRGAPSGLPGAIAIARWDHVYDMVYEGQAMKFGLFYELSVPRPWTRESERTVYNNALEQEKLADEVGFDQVWAVEHHFLEEYSHCSAPELFLTACAMVTKHIRVGHGIVI